MLGTGSRKATSPSTGLSRRVGLKRLVLTCVLKAECFGWFGRACIPKLVAFTRHLHLPHCASAVPQRLRCSKRKWWLVSNGEEVDLCLIDPGFEVGLYVATDLQTMTRVWMGDVSVKTAVGSGAIELDGSRDLRQRSERWLGLSGFAENRDAGRPVRAAADRTRPEQHGSSGRSV